MVLMVKNPPANIGRQVLYHQQHLGSPNKIYNKKQRINQNTLPYQERLLVVNPWLMVSRQLIIVKIITLSQPPMKLTEARITDGHENQQVKENRVTALNCYPTDYLIHIKGNFYKGKIEDSQVNQVIKLSFVSDDRILYQR